MSRYLWEVPPAILCGNASMHGADGTPPAAAAQDDPKFKAAMRTRNPEQRLRAFLALCGSRRFDEETGAPQPAYKMDSMRIMAEFPKPKARARHLL